MSESKKGRDMAATGDEGKGKGRAAMPPGGAPMPPGDNESKGEAAVSSNTENEGKEKTGTTPKADEGPGMDDLSRVKSYEPGNDDQLKPFTSEGETKYEGKGKNRSASFSHLPPPHQSAPSTAPSTAPNTRPVSEVPNDTAPTTAPSTRPVSEAQNASAPRPKRPRSLSDTDVERRLRRTRSATNSPTEEREDPAVRTAPGESVSTTGQGRSVSPLPPKRPLSESTNRPEGRQIQPIGFRPHLSGNVPQAAHYEGPPPPQPPVVKPTKDTSPTTSSQETLPLRKKATNRLRKFLKPAPKLPDPPEAPEPTTAPSLPNPPQAQEGAIGPQIEEPQESDAIELQDLAPNPPADEQRTADEEEVVPKPKRVELNEEDEIHPHPDDVDRHPFSEGEGEGGTGAEQGESSKNPLTKLSSPHHRRGILTRSILKKRAPAEPMTEADRAEAGVLSDDDDEDSVRARRRAERMYRATVARLWANASSQPREMAGSPIRVEVGGRPVPRLVIETNTGDAETAREEDSDGDDGPCGRFGKKYCPKFPKCVVM